MSQNKKKIADIDQTLESLPKGLEEVCMWSIGPSSQFKNHYVAAVQCELQKKYDLIIQWNIFATSHAGAEIRSSQLGANGT